MKKMAASCCNAFAIATFSSYLIWRWRYLTIWT